MNDKKEITVFECRRGRREDTVKVQLEIPKRTLEGFKKNSESPVSGIKYTPKQIMENILTNYIDGVVAK